MLEKTSHTNPVYRRVPGLYGGGFDSGVREFPPAGVEGQSSLRGTGAELPAPKVFDIFTEN